VQCECSEGEEKRLFQARAYYSIHGANYICKNYFPADPKKIIKPALQTWQFTEQLKTFDGGYNKTN